MARRIRLRKWIRKIRNAFGGFFKGEPAPLFGEQDCEVVMIEMIPDIEEPEAYLELAGRYGMGFEYNDFFRTELLDDSQALNRRISAWKGLERPAGVDTMHGAFYDLAPFSLDAGIRRHSLYRMQQSVEIAGRLGCRAVIFHTGLVPRFMSGAGYCEHWLDSMEETVNRLLEQDGHIEIYCENMLDESPVMLARLAERLKTKERFGICLDVSHLLLAGGDAAEWLRLLAPSIRHLHLNDTGMKTDDHLALGRGAVDWDEIFSLLDEYGLDKSSALLEMNGLEKIRESLSFLERAGRLPASV